MMEAIKQTETDANKRSEKDKITVVSNETIENLINSARGAIFGAVELHNKPIFPARYEVSIILTITAWEALLKAYILRFHPEKTIFESDQSTIAFDKCVSYVHNKIGKDFSLVKESLEQLYKYRCDIIHCYGEGIELILYSLLRPNILFFAEFLNKHFEINLSEEANLIILPVGFNATLTPIDFLNKTSATGNVYIKKFVAGLVKSLEKLSKEGIDDGLLCNYSMFLERENNPKHADLVIAFTKDPEQATLSLNKMTKIAGYTSDKNAPMVQIDEVTLFRDIFIYTYHDIRKKAAATIPNFSANKIFLDRMRQIQKDENLYRFRPIFVNKPDNKNRGQGFYSEKAYEKLQDLYDISPK